MNDNMSTNTNGDITGSMSTNTNGDITGNMSTSENITGNMSADTNANETGSMTGAALDGRNISASYTCNRESGEAPINSYTAWSPADRTPDGSMQDGTQSTTAGSASFVYRYVKSDLTPDEFGGKKAASTSTGQYGQTSAGSTSAEQYSRTPADGTQEQPNPTHTSRIIFGGDFSEPEPEVVDANGKTINRRRCEGRPSKHPKLRKVLGFIACALGFGILAGGAFIGTSEIYKATRPTSAISSVISRDSKDITNEAGWTLAPTTTVTPRYSGTTDVSRVYEKCITSIVSIDGKYTATNWFGQSYETGGSGSGIIIGMSNDELLIATNNHVVANSTSLKVTFNDGSTAEAKIKGTDEAADLAVIYADLTTITEETLSNISIATLGSSDDIKVGEMVIAIGNALGYGQSLTAGYVSAVNRDVTIEGNKMTLIQTDAAINPGNSGGALLNLKGEVIGINNMKYANESVEGMGFAIPISKATDILDDLMTKEILEDGEKGYLGVYMQDITESFSKAYGWPIGVYVQPIEDFPAMKAGILTGDIVVAVNGKEVRTTDQLRERISGIRSGSTVTITVKRLEDGEFVEHDFDVVLAARPSDEELAKQNP